MSWFNSNSGDNFWWVIIAFLLLGGDNGCLNNIRGMVCGDNLWLIIILLLLCNGECGNDCGNCNNNCGCTPNPCTCC